MSSGLSRVESHKRRRLEEKKKPPLLRKDLSEEKDINGSEHPVSSQKMDPLRRSVVNDKEDKEDIEDIERDIESDQVPLRSNTYSSLNVKFSKIFLNTLITLFIILTGALVWWGIEGAPPWKEIWRWMH